MLWQSAHSELYFMKTSRLHFREDVVARSGFGRARFPAGAAARWGGIRHGLNRPAVPHYVAMILDGNRRWALGSHLWSTSPSATAGAPTTPPACLMCELESSDAAGAAFRASCRTEKELMPTTHAGACGPWVPRGGRGHWRYGHTNAT
jgi:hypothetical protein